MEVEEKGVYRGEVRTGEDALAGKIAYANWTKVWMPSVQGSQGIFCSWRRGVWWEDAENWQMPDFGGFQKPSQEVQAFWALKKDQMV